MQTLAFLLLATMQRNNTGVVSVSMGIFDYGYLVTTAFSQTRHNIHIQIFLTSTLAGDGWPASRQRRAPVFIS
jgi:hypothetical protein